MAESIQITSKPISVRDSSKIDTATKNQQFGSIFQTVSGAHALMVCVWVKMTHPALAKLSEHLPHLPVTYLLRAGSQNTIYNEAAKSIFELEWKWTFSMWILHRYDYTIQRYWEGCFLRS